MHASQHMSDLLITILFQVPSLFYRPTVEIHWSSWHKWHMHTHYSTHMHAHTRAHIRTHTHTHTHTHATCIHVQWPHVQLWWPLPFPLLIDIPLCNCIRPIGDTTAATAMAVPVVRAHSHPVQITEIVTPHHIYNLSSNCIVLLIWL